MYTIRQASARSGVGIPLLRAWERRYGVVEPTRTPAGYRLYDDEAIARLVAMRRLIDEGWAPQQAAAQIRDSDLEELSRLGEAPPARERERSSGVANVAPPELSTELVERIVDAARELDAAALDETLDETFATLRFETAWEAVIVPALHRVGDAWERGEISVAGEHASAEAIRRRLAMAYEAAAVSTDAAPILVGLPPGAHHELGALAFATAARRAGFPVLYLGADLPVESWAIAASERDARAAIIGVPRRSDVSRAKAVADALRAERPGMLVAMGGDAADHVRRDDVAVVSGSVSDGVAAIRRALAAHGGSQKVAEPRR